MIASWLFHAISVLFLTPMATSRNEKHLRQITVIQPHPQNPEMLVCTVGLFVTGHAFPSWASAHLAQMAPGLVNTFGPLKD